MRPIPSVKTKISWYKAVLIKVEKEQNKSIQDLLRQYLDKNGEGETYLETEYWDLIPEIYEQRTTDSMIYWFSDDKERGRALVIAIMKLTATPQQELEWLERVLPTLESLLGSWSWGCTCVGLCGMDLLFENSIRLSCKYFSSWPCEYLLPTLYNNKTCDGFSWFNTQEERVEAVKKSIAELKLSQNGNES